MEQNIHEESIFKNENASDTANNENSPETEISEVDEINSVREEILANFSVTADSCYEVLNDPDKYDPEVVRKSKENLEKAIALKDEYMKKMDEWLDRIKLKQAG